MGASSSPACCLLGQYRGLKLFQQQCWVFITSSLWDNCPEYPNPIQVLHHSHSTVAQQAVRPTSHTAPRQHRTAQHTAQHSSRLSTRTAFCAHPSWKTPPVPTLACCCLQSCVGQGANRESRLRSAQDGAEDGLPGSPAHTNSAHCALSAVCERSPHLHRSAQPKRGHGSGWCLKFSSKEIHFCSTSPHQHNSESTAPVT